MSGSSSLDVSEIKGNLTVSQKRTATKIFQHFIGTPDTSFGAEIGRNLRIVEISVGDSRGEEFHIDEDEGFAWDEEQGAYRSFGNQRKRNETRTATSISTKDAVARTVCEIDVTPNMCNVYGTLHGGCAAYMIDPCSVSALVSLGIVTGVDGTGVSQSMSLQWHRSATV
ncbi:hypothetical protein PQX77_011739 [Marasmius sp. AFHP31]|nr:hypothetical protein PQX77_011739 [Marasmius sp. AFHP31]